MKIFLLFLALHSHAFFPSHEISDEKSNLDIIKAYLQARQKSMQENATSEDIEKIMGYYSDSLYYEHVLSAEKKFVFHGKDDLRNGYISHLGETRNVKIALINYIQKQNIFVAEYSTTREIIANGKIEEYKTVSLYELDENGQIKHVIDYL
jgi:hypothetical protein